MPTCKEEVQDLLGDFISAVSDEARDRIVQEQEWGCGSVLSATSKRCLLGVVEDWRYEFDGRASPNDQEMYDLRSYSKFDNIPIGTYFDNLVVRFGMADTVKAIKDLAGSRVTLSTVAECPLQPLLVS